jgi:hypothetical protein
MSSATFRVVTRGLQPDHSAEIAAELLTRLFKCGKDKVAPLIDSRPVTVKRRLTFEAATKYAQALTRCGCVCMVEEEPLTPLTLSDERLQRLQPKLFDMARWASQADRDSWMDAIRDTLAHGAARAAVVVDAAGSVVAAYTDELDCVVLLQFDEGFGLVHGWQKGTRLLSVNAYFARDQGMAPDLLLGPGDSGRWGNVWPLIADLLSDDHAGLAARKRAIPEAQWERAGQLGRSALAGAALPRDGRPLGSRQPVQAPAIASVAAPAPAPRRFSLRRRAGD